MLAVKDILVRKPEQSIHLSMAPYGGRLGPQDVCHLAEIVIDLDLLSICVSCMRLDELGLNLGCLSLPSPCGTVLFLQ